MTKSKRIILMVLVLVLLLVADNIQSLSYLKLSEEERIVATLNKEPFSIAEVDDGYVCISSEPIGNEECLSFTYIKRELFGDTGFNLRGLVADSYKRYVNNKSYKTCHQ